LAVVAWQVIRVVPQIMANDKAQMPNPQWETLNPKQYQSTKYQSSKPLMSLRGAVGDVAISVVGLGDCHASLALTTPFLSLRGTIVPKQSQEGKP